MEPLGSSSNLIQQNQNDEREQIRQWSYRAKQAYDSVAKRLKRTEELLRLKEQHNDELTRALSDSQNVTKQYQNIISQLEHTNSSHDKDLNQMKKVSAEREQELQNSNYNLRALASTYLEEVRQFRESSAAREASQLCINCKSAVVPSITPVPGSTTEPIQFLQVVPPENNNPYPDPVDSLDRSYQQELSLGSRAMWPSNGPTDPNLTIRLTDTLPIGIESSNGDPGSICTMISSQAAPLLLSRHEPNTLYTSNQGPAVYLPYTMISKSYEALSTTSTPTYTTNPNPTSPLPNSLSTHDGYRYQFSHRLHDSGHLMQLQPLERTID